MYLSITERFKEVMNNSYSQKELNINFIEKEILAYENAYELNNLYNTILKDIDILDRVELSINEINTITSILKNDKCSTLVLKILSTNNLYKNIFNSTESYNQDIALEGLGTIVSNAYKGTKNIIKSIIRNIIEFINKWLGRTDYFKNKVDELSIKIYGTTYSPKLIEKIGDKSIKVFSATQIANIVDFIDDAYGTINIEGTLTEEKLKEILQNPAFKSKSADNKIYVAETYLSQIKKEMIRNVKIIDLYNYLRKGKSSEMYKSLQKLSDIYIGINSFKKQLEKINFSDSDSKILQNYYRYVFKLILGSMMRYCIDLQRDYIKSAATVLKYVE